MADFVPDDRADGTVVGRCGSQRVKEWRLQDGGREAKSVLQWQVDGVYRLRIHGPFLAVDRCAQTPEFSLILKQAATPNVAEGVVRFHFVGGVVNPYFRVSDTYVQSVELGLGFGFRGGCHPGQSVNSLSEMLQ